MGVKKSDPAPLTVWRIASAMAILCALALTSYAATSTVWEVSGFNDLMKGRVNGLSVDANGRLQTGLSTVWTSSLGQPAFWSMVAAPDGSIYAATGHSGKVFRVSPAGQASSVWSSQQSEVFALCLDSRGALFAGTSPNGGLYRIQNGQAQEVWHSPTRYIWSLQAGPDGSIYIGTGQPGRVYRYDGKTKTDLYYETGQQNVTALAAGDNGHVSPAPTRTVCCMTSLPKGTLQFFTIPTCRRFGQLS